MPGICGELAPARFDPLFWSRDEYTAGTGSGAIPGLWTVDAHSGESESRESSCAVWPAWGNAYRSSRVGDRAPLRPARFYLQRRVL